MLCSRSAVKLLMKPVLTWLPACNPTLHWTTGPAHSSLACKKQNLLPLPANQTLMDTWRMLSLMQCNTNLQLKCSVENVILSRYTERNCSVFVDSKKQQSYTYPNISCRNFKTKPYEQSSEVIESQNIPQLIVEKSPVLLQPYLKLIRFDRPIGTWLLFLPASWSIALAAEPGCLPDLQILGLFGVGAFLMRGAGCIINDMWDKELDAKVARTKDRPLACGRLTPFQALTFLGINLTGALGILLSLNWYSIALGASSLSLVVTYPLMKRVTYWPQLFLGMTFNWGTMLGWAAVRGSCDWGVVLPLYAACVAWTMHYDTLYAHQDKADDVLVGVKSTALRFGDQSKYWLSGFTSLMVSSLTYVGVACDQTWPYYTGLGLLGLHLASQIVNVNLSDPDSCGKAFRSNKKIGIFFLMCIIGGNLLKPKDKNSTEKTDS